LTVDLELQLLRTLSASSPSAQTLTEARTVKLYQRSVTLTDWPIGDILSLIGKCSFKRQNPLLKWEQ